MTIVVPEHLNDLTLEQFMKFDLANKGDDEEFILHKIISIFCNISMKDSYNIKLDYAEDIANDISDVLSNEGKFQKTFEYNNKTWGFIPNLEDISLGEFIDLDNYLKDTQTLNKAMAVLYRPVTKQYKELYSIEPYEGASKYAQELKGMPLGVATAASVFFYRLGNELVKHSGLYSMKLRKVMSQSQTTQQKDSSQGNMDGLQSYMNLVEVMLQSLKK